MGLDDRTIKKLRGLILYAAVVVLLCANWRHLLALCGYLLGLLRPFLLGGAIAFVLNIPMRALEQHIFAGIRKQRFRRCLSLVSAVLIVMLILLFAAVAVIPQLTASVLSLREKIPAFLTGLSAWAEAVVFRYPELSEFLQTSSFDWTELAASAQTFLTKGFGSVLSGSFLAVKGIAGAFASFGIGFVFALYLLLGKERLSAQVKKVLLAFLPERAAKGCMYVAALSERRFSGFLTGQCLEACILGLMFVIVLSLFRLPYAVLCGVLIAFTALVPVFGAFIGFFVGAFLMLIQSPGSALLFMVIFLVLQQIEGNLIYPQVVGNSVELPAIWVLCAVTLGGSMFGIIGMLVFIPLLSVLYTLLGGQVRKRLSAAAGGKACPESAHDEPRANDL